MADKYDGTVKILAELDDSKLKSGLQGIGSFAKKGFSAIATASAAAVTAVGAGATALGKYAVDVGSSFEAGMSEVSAISGATGADLESLKAKAEEMGAKTKFSATESAEAMKYMAMAGWQTGDMLNGIEGIMNLAAASGEDLATTSDIVTDALTAFGLKAEDSGHFADVLAKASSSANTNVSLMGETFKYVAPVAGALGYSVDDCAVAIGLMANSGIKGSQAGTALRSVLSRMTKPTDEVAMAMDTLGLSLVNADGTMKPLNEVMLDMRESFSGLTEAEKASMAASLGGQEAMSGLLAIVNASDEDFAKLTEQIQNCNGAAEETAETMQDNLQGQLTIMKSAAEALGIAIYDDIQTPLKDLVKVGNDALNELTDAWKNGGVAGFAEAGGRIIVNLIAGAAKKVPDLIKLTTSVVTSVTQSIQNALPGLMINGHQIVESLMQGLIQTGPQLLATGNRLLFSLLADLQLNLPSLVEMGTQFLVSMIQGVTDMLPMLVPLAVDVALQLVDALLDNLPVLVDAGIQFIIALAEGLINALPTLIEKVPEIINKFWDEFDQNGWKLVKAGVTLIVKLGEGIIQSVPVIIDNIGSILSAIVKTILHLDILSLGRNLIKSMASGIKGSVNAIIDAIKAILHNITHPFDEVSWSSIGKNAIDGIKNGIVGAAKGLADAAKGAVENAFNGIKNFLGIHSPSRLMRDVIGKNMVAGIEVGFDMESDDLQKQAVNTIDDTTQALRQRINASAVVANMQAAASHKAVVVQAEQEHPDKYDVPDDDDNGTSGDGKHLTIEVPVKIDKREVARATAEVSSEQMAWEEL